MKMKMKILSFVTCALAVLTNVVLADPIKDNNVEQTTTPTAAAAFSECLEADSISCLQLTVRIHK